MNKRPGMEQDIYKQPWASLSTSRAARGPFAVRQPHHVGVGELTSLWTAEGWYLVVCQEVVLIPVAAVESTLPA
jgi:hypothetical protein